tara:strand:- start:482 stop:949 length:468 start_codon:yes stop_codon:yes gene_type:complete
MRLDIHPEYSEIKATCSCGNVILIKSTLKEDISLDVCSSCHPFYTGKQKLVDTGGRVERFEKRFGKKPKTKAKVEDLTSTKPEVKEAEIKDVSKEEADKKEEAKETKKDTPKETAKKKTPIKKASAKKASAKKTPSKEETEEIVEVKEKKKDLKK